MAVCVALIVFDRKIIIDRRREYLSLFVAIISMLIFIEIFEFAIARDT